MTRVVLDAKTRTIKNVQCHNRPYGNCSLLEAAIKIYDMNRYRLEEVVLPNNVHDQIAWRT